MTRNPVRPNVRLNPEPSLSMLAGILSKASMILHMPSEKLAQLQSKQALLRLSKLKSERAKRELTLASKKLDSLTRIEILRHEMQQALEQHHMAYGLSEFEVFSEGMAQLQDRIHEQTLDTIHRA